MPTLREIVDAFLIDKVSETYPRSVEITNLKADLGTRGDILVIRGDKAYADELGENKHLANPKFWLYENLINSPRIQQQLRLYPNHKLFDGVGFSSLEALGYHAKRIGRKAVVVMAREMIPDSEVFKRYDIEVIHADEEDGPMEEGYVKKQVEVLSKREDLIPLHQALHGAKALAPVGNRVLNKLEKLCVTPDETFWCIASGSNLYGIGAKIKSRFKDSRTIVVEPSENPTIDPSLDLSNPNEVKLFSKQKLRDYSLREWDRMYSGIAPLHVAHPNRYMLINWAHTGNIGFDEVRDVPTEDVIELQKRLKSINPDYNWTKTTILTLVPAIESARNGKNVLVMAYGKDRKTTLKYLNNVPWLFRGETLAQRVALGGLITAWMAFGIYYMLNANPDAPPLYFIN